MTAVSRLGLKNVRVIEVRSGNVPEAQAQNVVTRATFSNLEDLRACERWAVPGGQLIAYRAEASGDATARVHVYQLRDERRVLEIWEKTR